MSMSSLFVSVAVGILTFGLGLLGLYLKRLVPERHMSAGSRDMIGAVIGLLSLLLALVLGTLVGSAYGFFATQKGDIESLCARSLELDLAFRQYGPETQPLRQALRDSIEALDALRGDSAAYQRHFELGGYMSKFEKWNETLSSLSPRSPAQTALVSSMSASSAAFQQTRLLMSLQLASPISWPLIVIVVSWAMLLFFGFGVTSGLNPTSLGALAFGSFAVASAIFLILELNQPFSGLFRVPSAPIERAIAALGSSQP
jgi:ABC-type multidrug transport system fused ATPase/permease subunit